MLRKTETDNPQGLKKTTNITLLEYTENNNYSWFGDYMYDLCLFEFDYSDDGKEYDVVAKTTLEDHSLLMDRKYKESKDAIATKRIRYNEISDVSLTGSTVTIKTAKGDSFLKAADGDMVETFYNNLVEIVENYDTSLNY